MSAGNLEGSWHYMLLSNDQIVKRTKPTALPVPHEVITHLNNLAANRKINKANNTNQPIFLQNRRVIPDDRLDYEDDVIYNNNTRRFSSTVNDLSNEVYDDIYVEEFFEQYADTEIPIVNESPVYDDAQLDTDDVNIESVEYDDTAIEYDTPDVESTHINDDVLTCEQTDDIIPEGASVLQDKLPEIEQPALRRSARNHQPGRWASTRGRNIGCRIPEYLHNCECSYAFNMSVEEGINKLGEIAVDSIRKEMQ